MCNSAEYLCTILPPHILTKLCESDRHRARALRTITLTEQARGRRAILGAMLAAVPAGTLRRTIFDAQNTENLPGKLVRGEGDAATDDVAVTEAYDYSGNTYDFYEKIFGRNSVDDKGQRLDSSVHYGQQYDNAFWDGRQMIYGDGDGELFNRFTLALDVIGHELTHGVTQHEANLTYSGQSGALNESISDVFGIQVKQFALKQTVAQSDWLIGADIVGPALKPALRSMKAPGTANPHDSQPADMDHYIPGGDVHVNSGIPNKAFYVVATTLGGKAWDAAGRIWYATLTDQRLQPGATFQDFARLTIASANRLFGQNSAQTQAVKAGWDAVKVPSV